MQKTLNRFFKLKQNNRSYAEYFEEIRKIEKDLSCEIANIISTRLVQDLDNEILKMFIKDIMSQNIAVNDVNRVFLNLEATIRIIKGAFEDMDKKNDSAMKQIKYRNLKFSERVLTDAFEANFKLMNETLKNNVKFMKSMMNKFFFNYNRQSRQNQSQQHGSTSNSDQSQNLTYNSGEQGIRRNENQDQNS